MPWLAGVSRRIWEAVTFGTSPLVTLLLRKFGFLKKYAFIDDLTGLVWRLRRKFATSPAVLGVVLSCTSVVPGDLPLLQGLPLAAEFGGFVIPPSDELSELRTSYRQIQKIINDFVKEYNEFVDSLERFGAKVVDRRRSELIPQTTITFASINSTLSMAAVWMATELKTLEKCLLDTLTCGLPLCRFVVREREGVDLFGFTKDEWRRAFRYPLSSKAKRVFAKPDGRTALDNRTLLVNLAWLYSKKGEFKVTDFCADVDLGRFLQDKWSEVHFMISRRDLIDSDFYTLLGQQNLTGLVE
jgi:hypothetical protein